MARGKVKRDVLGALSDLHRNSSNPVADQWFSRKKIARQLPSKSGKLNSRRKNALEELRRSGLVDRRLNPRKKNISYEYKLSDTNIDPSQLYPVRRSTENGGLPGNQGTRSPDED